MVAAHRPATETETEAFVRSSLATGDRAMPDVDRRSAQTSPLRIYAFDHQPIRLLAELNAMSPAELVHRALSEYMERHRDTLSGMHRLTQDLISAGDLDGLAALLAQARSLESRDAQNDR